LFDAVIAARRVPQDAVVTSVAAAITLPPGNDRTSKSKFAPTRWIPAAIRAAPDSISFS